MTVKKIKNITVELIQGKFLKPTPSIRVSVEIVPEFDTVDSPTCHCESCRKLLLGSGILILLFKINHHQNNVIVVAK